jgi:hypothetical protein
MKTRTITIHPESGRLSVDFTTSDGSQTCLIEFGHSFTLRLEEEDIDKLREALYEASRELMLERNAIDMANGEPFDQNGNVVVEGPTKNSELQEIDPWSLPEEDEVTGYPV